MTHKCRFGLVIATVRISLHKVVSRPGQALAVQTSLFAKEAHLALCIATHEADDDGFFLSTCNISVTM